MNYGFHLKKKKTHNTQHSTLKIFLYNEILNYCNELKNRIINLKVLLPLKKKLTEKEGTSRSR